MATNRAGFYRIDGELWRAGRRVWTAVEDALLRQLYPDTPNDQIAQQLRRTVKAIYGRAKVLRVKKSAAYLASPHACRLRRGDHVGAAFRFKPGQIPQNKGQRRPGWAVGRMTATQFKKGHRPQTWVPIGTEVVDRDGCRKRKVADERRPSRFNWRFVHTIVWEAAHGPVPAGHAIAFRNGDHADVSLDNLELITRRELMRRNTVHNLPKPLAQTIQLLGALKRQIRRREGRAEEKQDRRSARSPVRDAGGAAGRGQTDGPGARADHR